MVAEVSTDDPRLTSSITKLQDSLKRDRGLVLDKLIKDVPRSSELQPPTRKLVLSGKGYIEVVKTVIAEGFDLLVKSANSKSALTSALFGSNDIRLLQNCPCPVLILKLDRRKRIRNILAAVDPTTGKPAASDLNSIIMETAVSMARIEEAKISMLHVWDLPMLEHFDSQENRDEFKVLTKGVLEETQRKMNQLVGGYAHVPVNDHLLKGKPQEVIPKFVQKQGIDLIVMGTVVRSGVPGFFFGNTGEKILYRIDCSVLALKPNGWKSPIKLQRKAKKKSVVRTNG